MFGLFFGCILMSIGINMFLKLYIIVFGGFSGLLLVLNKVIGFLVLVIMLIIGVLLVIFVFRIMGIKNLLKILFGIVVFLVIV